MANKITFNPKRDLPYLAAVAQAAQFSLAGSILLGGRGWFFGGLLGLLISATMAYASSQISELAKNRKPFALAGMILLGLFSPVIVGVSMFLDLPLGINPTWRVIVGALWGVLPDASIALTGFVAGKGLVKKDDEGNKPNDAQPGRSSKKKLRNQSSNRVSDVELVAAIKKQPGATDEQLAQLFGVSRQAIQKRRKKITPSDLGLAKGNQ